MVEEFDARQAFSLTFVWIAVAIVGFCFLLEYGPLNWLRTTAKARNLRWTSFVLQAAYGQALFWGILVATAYVVFQYLGDLQQRQQVLTIAAIAGALSGTVFLVRLATGWAHVTLEQSNLRSISLIDSMLNFAGGVIVVLTALALSGVSITPILTGIAASSVGVAFALRDMLGNLFSGVLLVLSNRVQPGDYIEFSTGQRGFVNNIYWHTTTIRELSGIGVNIPNSVMVTEVIKNYTRPQTEVPVVVPIALTYDSDLQRSEEIVLEVAADVMASAEGAVEGFTPVVMYNGLAEYSIRANVIMRAQTFPQQFGMQHMFIKRLRERFLAEGIPVPFPTQMLRAESAVMIDPARGSAPEPAAQRNRRVP